MNAMLTQVVMLLLTSIKKKETQDRVLDFFEDLIQDSATEWDDKILLPMIRAYRKIANVPDND